MTDPTAFYVGAMTGTSVDGLDLALISISNGKIGFEAARTLNFETDLANALHDLASGHNESLDELGRIDRQLGETIGRSVSTFLEEQGLDAARVRAIGSHGQTVRHRPAALARFTLQIGDPNRIAEQTGIDTVADFRRRDIAAGGQGAPLVAPFHAALFRTPSEERVVVNIGGIANVTHLPADLRRPLSGFDTGPGNTLLDQWIYRHRGIRYDDGGRWGASGVVASELLDRLLCCPYFARVAPKSTGREEFGLPWLDSMLTDLAMNAADVQATLTALTATTIARGIRQVAGSGTSVILCGGGRHNRALVAALIAALPDMIVRSTDDYGYDGDFIEAAAFAWLAHLTVNRLPGNAPDVTGARGPRILGGIYAK